jgi:hypothetical protein
MYKQLKYRKEAPLHTEASSSYQPHPARFVLCRMQPFYYYEFAVMLHRSSFGTGAD